MTQSRQLAAIMFTDIVGYTALMGEDEQKAFELLKKNRVVQRPIIEKFYGRWIKEIGDGVLASFTTVTDAVYCAITIQKACENIPELNLRIGIHLGEVIFEGNDVFGDGVNIASRLEPLAPSGGILVSESVSRNLGNKRNIETYFSGEQSLKNVKDPIRVYEVKVTNIQDALVETSTSESSLIESIKPTPKSSRKVLFQLFSIILIIMMGWWFWEFLRPSDTTISESITESRIAVLPYENKTNDPELDVLGEMAADWIIKGLMNFEDLKIVSYQNVKDNFEYAALGNWNIFSEQTGAENVIRGSFYQQGDQLIFQSWVIDGLSGDIDYVLPEISGSKTNPEKLVNDLKQRIMTLFADVESDASFTGYIKKNPPGYDAYRYYIESSNYEVVDYPKAIEYLSKAIGADSSFFWPYLKSVFSYSNQGYFEKTDSVFRLIDPLVDTLTPYEKLWYDYLKEYHYGSTGTLYSAIKRIYEKDPKDSFNNLWMASRASGYNKPNEGIQVFEQLGFKDLDYKTPTTIWRYEKYAYSLIRMNKLDEAYKILNHAPKRWVYTSSTINALKAYLYILNNQEDSIQHLIKKMEDQNSPEELVGKTIEHVVSWYSLLGDKTNQLKWSQLNLERIDRHSKMNKVKLVTKADANYIAKRYDNALIYYQELSKTKGNNWFSLSRIGLIYAKTNNRESAEVIIKNLENINGAITRGRYKYAIAQIYAALNEKELAIEYMKQAFNEGFGFEYNSYDFDSEFVSLHGYTPYEDFVKPKG